MCQSRFAFACLCIGFTISAQSAELPEEAVYSVKPGDTLIGLGNRLLLEPRDWKKVQRLNAIRDPYRILPGTRIRLPIAWLRPAPAEARVLQVTGDAGGIQPGTVLSAGDELRTGKDGYVTIELVDGSKLTLQSQSRLRFEHLNRYPGTGAVRSTLELETGRVESTLASKRGAAGRFELRTPVATTAVRGTRFRAGWDQSKAQSEVLEGRVAVIGEGAPPAAALAIDAGFGTVVDQSRRPSPPVKLLAAPDLSQLPALAERVLVRFHFGAVSGAVGYRAQVARDRGFQQVVAEGVFRTPELRFSDLPDADYWLRVRSIDKLTLEGLDSYHFFRLKARPEPPFLSAPRANAKVSGDAVELQWTKAPEAAAYRVQLARDPAFKDLVKDEARASGQTLRVESLIPGNYHWRVASVRVDGDQGPFGDPQGFTLKPLPAIPDAPALTDRAVDFSWAGEPGQTFRLQVARDEGFASPIADLKVSEPQATLPRPEPGTYYLRVQAIDADGYVGPYSAVQRFEVPREPIPWWLLVLPLIPFLL